MSLLLVCCIILLKITPKLTHNSYLKVSVGQEFRSSLGGWLWFGASHELLIKMLVGASVIWRLNWAGESASKLTHMTDDNSLSSSLCWASPLACSPHGSWLPETNWQSNRDRSCSVGHNATSKVTYYHTDLILLFTHINLVCCVRGLYTVQTSGGRVHWGLSWKPVTTFVNLGWTEDNATQQGIMYI